MQLIDFKVKLPVKNQKRKKWLLASCPVLDIHSQGETEERAKKNLAEAISLFSSPALKGEPWMKF